MGLIDKNDDGHVSIGEAAFAHEQLEEYRKASRGSGSGGFGNPGSQVVGCGFLLGTCGGCLLSVAAFVAVIALLFWLIR